MQKGTYKMILINKIQRNSTVDSYQDLRKKTIDYYQKELFPVKMCNSKDIETGEHAKQQVSS